MNRSDGSTAAYYELPKECSELQHLISHRDMNAQVGEIFRACYRYGIVSHSDKLRDAKKMRFYAQAEIERLEKIEANVKQSLAVKSSSFCDPFDTFGQQNTIEPASEIDDESQRQLLIQQSGEMAEEVYAAVDGAPSWDEAPKWAMWLAQDSDGEWCFFQLMPKYDEGDDYWNDDCEGNSVTVKNGCKPNIAWRNTLKKRPNKDA